MMGYLYLILAILGTSFGQIMLKKHSMQEKKISLYLLISLVLFISVPFFIYLSLLYINFIIVFLSDAISIIAIVILSSVLLNETIDKNKAYGIIFILMGMIIIQRKLI